jgi:hypothetical protein
MTKENPPPPEMCAVVIATGEVLETSPTATRNEFALHRLGADGVVVVLHVAGFAKRGGRGKYKRSKSGRIALYPKEGADHAAVLAKCREEDGVGLEPWELQRAQDKRLAAESERAAKARLAASLRRKRA